MDGAVVLRDVEVDGPGAEGIGHLLVGGPEFGVGVAFFDESMLRGVVAQRVEVGVGEVGLEAESVLVTYAFEDVEHVLPGVHAGPADLAFGGEALAVILGDGSCLLEGIDDAGGIRLRVFLPLGDAELGGVDADAAVFADAGAVEDLRDAAGHLHGVEEFRLLGVITHGAVTHGAGPNGSHEGTDGESACGDLIGDLLDLVIAGIRVGVREEEEVVDAFKLLAVHIRGGGEVEHALEADRGFLAFAIAFADEAGPHRVVKFGCGFAHV